MRVLFLAALWLMTACSSEPQSRGDGEAAAAQRTLSGEFRALSQTARVATGDVSIERGGVIFEKGVVLYTRTIETRSAHERMARDGDSYAAAAVGPSDLIVELRRVTDQTLGRYARSPCGEEAPEYIALAYDEPAASVTLLVFAGEEPPSPSATQSRLCVTLAYAARDGARTRQGVVL